MAKKSEVAFIALITIVVLFAALSLPGFFKYFYQQGAGHAFGEIMDSENPPWNSMTKLERKPYQIRSFAKGRECALFMTLGQHIPMYLFILITVGLLNPFIKSRFRVFLRYSFWVVWILGIVFLAIGSGYWGQALQLPAALLPATMIYTIVAIVCGVVLGVGKFVQKNLNNEIRK
ncbi:MAG: hypothetical protein K8S27_12225 [Candidatus Omnitrophica bacterium]|nr:hypothetical protein [Candidatus Omnitrophota bacterium]